MRPAVLLGLAALAIHLFANGGYGIFRDELYFIVCGWRLDWGYVDQPPLVPLIAAWSHALAGDWLTGFRFVPALVAALTVAATVEFARDLGGGRFAQVMAGVCMLAAPVFMVQGVYVSTDMFQGLTWLGASWCVVKVAREHDERWWLAFALVTAFSLWSKYGIVFFAGALAVGALFTPLRRSLARPWIYIAAGLVLLLVLPNLLWQQHHGWPFIELGLAGVNGKNRAMSPVEFFAQQVLLVGPASILVWGAGLFAFAIKPKLDVLRAFPIAYGLLAVYFIAEHGKSSYLMPIYPVFFAGGALFWEEFAKPLWLRAAGLALPAVAGAMLAPLAMPILPERTFIAYSAAIGLSPKSTAAENLQLGQLPQHFADMHGWPQLAAQIAAVYHRLPPQERAKAVFFGTNYGEAAAIDVYGRDLGLPPAISGHNNYYLWGPRGHDGSVVIEIGGTREDILRIFESVEQAGVTDEPYAMPYETGQPIWIERGLKEPLGKVWPKVKKYR